MRERFGLSAEALQDLFRAAADHYADLEEGVWSLYCDGASRGNPGLAGAGVVLIDPSGEVREEQREFLGQVTNNVAEYRGLLLGLKRARDLGVKRARWGENGLSRRRIVRRWRRWIAELFADSGRERRRARRAARLLRLRSSPSRRSRHRQLTAHRAQGAARASDRERAGLQFNGHETGDGELIRKHACELGFEGVVSKTIDAPYAPGNRGLWRKSKCLNRQEFVVVGWTDPEGSRPSSRRALARLLH